MLQELALTVIIQPGLVAKKSRFMYQDQCERKGTVDGLSSLTVERQPDRRQDSRPSLLNQLNLTAGRTLSPHCHC